MIGSADERALLAAICAAPDDDTPRLVYADWLDEHGDEAARARAEFIRLQCAVVRVGFDPRRRRAYGKRLRFLLQRYEFKWRATLPDVRPGTWGEFTRGMVDSLTIPLGANFAFALGPLTCVTPLRLLVCEASGGSSIADVRVFLNTDAAKSFDEIRFEPEGRFGGEGDMESLVRGLIRHTWCEKPRTIDLTELWLDSIVHNLLANWPRGRRHPRLRVPSTLLGPDGRVDVRESLEARFGERVEFA